MTEPSGLGRAPSFEGRTAIITGASRGIRSSIAQELVGEGARVVVPARNSDALEKAVVALGGSDRALAVGGRANDPEHQNGAVSRVMDTFGGIDSLVKCQTTPVGSPATSSCPTEGRHAVATSQGGWWMKRHQSTRRPCMRSACDPAGEASGSDEMPAESRLFNDVCAALGYDSRNVLSIRLNRRAAVVTSTDESGALVTATYADEWGTLRTTTFSRTSEGRP